MGYENLLESHFWTRYSKKMGSKIDNPRAVGRFTAKDATERGMRLVLGRAGEMDEGSAIILYCLVDESDGIFVDVRFQIFGSSALIAAAEGACEILVGKSHDQIKRIGVELIDKQLRDRPNYLAFPQEVLSELNLVLLAIENAREQCVDILCAQAYVSPLPHEATQEDGHPDWPSLNYEQKIALIEEVLNVEVRPYVELDEGGIEVHKLVDDRELHISYQGACTTCYSAIGTTLSAIQQIVQTKIHPGITVIPNMDALHL